MAERGDLFWLQAQGDAPPLRCVVAAAGTGVLVAAGGVQRSVCEQQTNSARCFPPALRHVRAPPTAAVQSSAALAAMTSCKSSRLSLLLLGQLGNRHACTCAGAAAQLQPQLWMKKHCGVPIVPLCAPAQSQCCLPSTAGWLRLSPWLSGWLDPASACPCYPPSPNC